MMGIRIKRIYLILTAILILLVFLNYAGAINFIKDRLRLAFLPIFTQTNNISVNVGDNYEFFRNKSAFFDAYRKCRSEMETESVELSKLKLLQDENNQLKDALNFREKTKLNSVVARVVGKNIEQTDQTILIDRGTEDGIALDQPVIVGNGILVGKIIKAENGLSVVRLINDNQSKIAGAALNGDKSLGVVEGGYGLSVKMNFIPRNETIRVGDVVVTSGLEQTIPRGLLIGAVTAIENETYRPFQSAVLAPGTDLAKIFLVSVIVSK